MLSNMVSVVLSDVMLSVVLLNALMLIVVAPFQMINFHFVVIRFQPLVK